MKLAGFEIDKIIYSLEDTVIARAITENGSAAILKYQNTQYPSDELNARWLHEHRMLNSIDSPWVIKSLGIEQANNNLVLLLEDHSSTSLAEFIRSTNLDLEQKLDLAIQLCSAVADIHKHQIIHCDISPKNALVNTETLSLKICDFGLSTKLNREQPSIKHRHLWGTLDYMSPEQTGRTNLDVDYRSDFYSLGITLYELFSGTRPFEYEDPTELLHAQIARPAAPLKNVSRNIPETLSNIILKLLEKSPDERYQSSYGLILDLKQCLHEWQSNGAIPDFTIGKGDVPERFCVSQKLYGREKEKKLILEAFDRASTGRAELLVISGYSGIGKTALVNELHKPIVTQRGLFIKGKCEQFNRNEPYAALIQAFQPLMRQLLNEGEEKLHYWRFMLRCALGANARIITDIIPELKTIVGSPPPLPLLPPAEEENRFHIAFTHFVNTLSCSGRPLVIFLDDLQWADQSTLKLLSQQLLRNDERALLIITAHRENEVDDTHPVTLILNEIQQKNQHSSEIKLSNLNYDDIGHLVSDTLQCSIAEANPLTELCLKKTQGNPFFLNQFLMNLHDENELIYNREIGCWQWNVDQIQQRGMTDNVIELMLLKLRKLEKNTQSLLSEAAHLGNRFTLKMLAIVTSISNRTTPSDLELQATAEGLWPALKAGLLVPLNEEYKFGDSPEKLAAAKYRFMHDRVQQASYCLTPDSERKPLQLNIGRKLLDFYKTEEKDKYLFTILQQFNNALELISDTNERNELRQLNIAGGIKAKSSSAYQEAVEFLRNAEQLLPTSPWKTIPDQTLILYKELAESEYLAGNFENAEDIYRRTIDKASCKRAKVTLLLVQSDQFQIQGKFSESLPILLRSLLLLGDSFPSVEKISDEELKEQYLKTETLIERFSKEQILCSQEMTSHEQLLRMRIYNALSFSTYQTGELKGFLYNSCKMVQYTLHNGQCDLTSIGFVAYVTVMSAMGRSYPECYQMGKLAKDIAENRDSKYFRLTIYQYFCAFYQHWCEPIENTFKYLDQGIQWGREGINLLSAGYCALLGAVNKFAKGIPLKELEEDTRQGINFLKNSHQINTENYLQFGILQPILALRGKTLSPWSFDTETQSTTRFFDNDYSTPTIHTALHTWAKLRHSYLLDDQQSQIEFEQRLTIVETCLPDGPAVVESNFFVALILLRSWGNERKNIQKENYEDDRFSKALLICEKIRSWSKSCKENFQHKYLILAAEIAKYKGEEKVAMGLYARAIESAKSSGCMMYEALANELYAKYWHELDQLQLSSSLIQESYFHYQRWGAVVKCDEIRSRWPHVTFKLEEIKYQHSNFTNTHKKVSEQTQLIDLRSLLKANHFLSQELRLDSLLKKMMEVLLENAGAEHGAIILLDEQELVVEVIGKLNVNTYQVECQKAGNILKKMCDTETPILPDSIIHHVSQTQETIILDDAVEDTRFSYNRYLQKHKPKSILCLPIVSQGKLIAIVYLENNLLKGAFTPKHKTTLEMLSAQAAISLINARLYDQMEEKVAERTEELKQMSMKDGLTNIANRRSFDERLATEWQRASRNGNLISLLMIDIDHFKEYNDFYGHVVGDNCIIEVAKALVESAPRVTDFVARYGGEEFAILIADSNHECATEIAKACHENIRHLNIKHERSITSKLVTISIGVCTMHADQEALPNEIVERADKALYQAKQNGRNRAHMAEKDNGHG